MAAAAGSSLPLCTHRYALFVSYLGTRYKGSQRLVARDKSGEQDTVQEAIEWSLEKFLPLQRCRLTACSRTDRGVHALMNVYTLPLMDYTCPTEEMKHWVNFHLIRKNHDIVVNEVLLAPADFHPRKAAKSREYIYRLAVMNDARRSKFKHHDPIDLCHALPATELYRSLPLPCFDVDKAEEVLDLLRGEHDFKSFSHISPKAKEEDTVRELEISLTPASQNPIDACSSSKFSFYHVHFKSRAFLYNQIRRIVGALISVASFRQADLGHIKDLLDNPSYTSWRSNLLVAEPWGLYLSRINYDKSSFVGSIRTHKNKMEEKARSIPGIDGEMSDDDQDESDYCDDTIQMEAKSSDN